MELIGQHEYYFKPVNCSALRAKESHWSLTLPNNMADSKRKFFILIYISDAFEKER